MNYSELALWSVIELDVSVICACMPGMTALLRRLKQRSIEYIRSKSSTHTSRALDGKSEPQQAITKTTVISVLHSQGGDGILSESELELMERPRWSEPPFDSNRPMERG